MSVLPDELWRRIIEIGIETKTLDYKNLCCLSITCRTLRRRFSLVASSSFRLSFFRRWYEKDRERKRLAHRRVVLRIESEIAEHLRKMQEIKLHSSEEKEKMNKAVAELLNLRRIRQASVALNVWQPEVIRGRQRQMVKQSNVPIDIRINTLEMELNLCKQQIAGFDMALRLEKRRLHAAKEELASVKYHPLRDLSSTSCQLNECRIRNKKLKHSSTVSVSCLLWTFIKEKGHEHVILPWIYGERNLDCFR
ncbi:hypothetical protein DH2020_006366 [Rehmannia glutinosa]|uniref:F-box protein n=1 Tax=Rehmannia glutinosa TaxID=99300 RepID=A0ABR0XIT9_REHGL